MKKLFARIVYFFKLQKAKSQKDYLISKIKYLIALKELENLRLKELSKNSCIENLKVFLVLIEKSNPIIFSSVFSLYEYDEFTEYTANSIISDLKYYNNN